MKVRESQIEDYLQIKKLHNKYNLKILDEGAWIEFLFKNLLIIKSGNLHSVGWVIEENKNRRSRNYKRTIWFNK